MLMAAREKCQAGGEDKASSQTLSSPSLPVSVVISGLCFLAFMTTQDSVNDSY